MGIVILCVTAVGLAIVERLEHVRFRRQRLLRPFVGSDVVYLLTGYLAGGSIALAYVVAASRALGQAGVPRLESLELPLWLTVPVALVAIDAGNYVAHWLLHRIDALWEFHKVHHSSATLDWLAAFRSHLVEQMLRRVLAPLLLVVLGFPIPAVAIAAGVFTAWAAVNHSNLRFGPPWLDWLLVTPRLHRAHHVPATTQTNLGTVLTIWDRWRGTLATADPLVDDVLGVPGEERTYPQGWGRQLLEPVRRLVRGVLPSAFASR
jgi:sterol desaturase/sphingolipid hydroxylase (fatty acid hydroxylase superfamily)